MTFEPQPFGKYYLLDRIATGGMAEIYKAKTFGAVGFEKLIAIKRILPHLSQNSDFITMLIDEAKIAVQLNHMNIVQVFDLGKIENDYFIAMEYIQGKDLRSIMRQCEGKKRRISVENAVYIVVEICKGLDYAHRKKDQFGLPSGIVHRDISPQNILISSEGEVKIVDFGIAKASRKATETDAGVLKGKFAYMSPEQARGEEVDQKTDIYSTGIILYELLSGERLFHSDNNIKTLEKIKNFDIEPPFLPTDVPSELEYILMQALQNDPEDRYQSANDFQVDLTKFLYSSALDFTSKNLADLMTELFGHPEVAKEDLSQEEDAIELDTETRLMISQANQEVLVSREEELTPAGFAQQIVSAQQDGGEKDQRRVPSPQELFEEEKKSLSGKRKYLVWVLGLLLIAGLFLFRESLFEAGKGLVYRVKETLWTKGNGKPPGHSDNGDKPIPDLSEQSSIYVETEPSGARIYLNGKEVGELTPVLLKKVKPRTNNSIMLSFQNYEPYRTKIQTKPGEIFQLKVTLKRQVGKLFIDSKPPGANIYINDQLIGLTPLEKDKVYANADLAIKLTKEGYKDYFEVVRVNSGQTQIVRTHLNKSEGDFGSVRIESVPPGAQIILNGQEGSKITPNTINKLEVGKKYQLILRLKGYREYQTSVTIADGEITPITAYLKAIPEEIR